MKKFFVVILFAALVFVPCAVYAESMGTLNVVTDMPDATIYIDGQEAGLSHINNYQLPEGSHYISVMRNDKKIYAQTIYIAAGEVRTIPTSNFVDIRTNTPNRGALEVETARIRETRGNGAFGMFIGTPLSSPMAGLSFKYWFANPYGVQLLASAQGNSSFQDSQFGIRLLNNLGTKIWFEQPLDAYWAIGFGRKVYDDKTVPNKDYVANMQEVAVGLEFGIGNIFFSVEGGIENVSKDSENLMSMKVSGGIHYYF